MLIVLSGLTQCFYSNSTLIGVMQKKQYEITITNLDPSPIKCQAFNNSLSIAKLNYVDARTTKSIETEFQYFSNGSLKILFDSIPAKDFDVMNKLSIISYTMLLQEQLEVPGQFSLITNTLVNTSNCWSDLSLNYSRSGTTSYLNLSGTPNDCLINDPKIFIQYQVNGTWNSIPIAPLDPAPADYEGYKLPFVHLSTKFYRLNFSDSTAEIQKQIDTFFTEFTADRQMQIRLSMHFTQPGSSLEQQIFSYIRNISSQSMECNTQLEAFGAVSSGTLQIVGDLTAFNSCQVGTAFVNSSAIFMYQQNNDRRPINVIASMGGILFVLPSKNESVLTDPSVTDIILFITLIKEDGTILREEVKYYKAVLSCFYNFLTLVSYTDTCLIFFPVQSERCVELYSHKVKTRIQQILQPTAASSSRLVHQVYEFVMPFESVNYFKTCLKGQNTTRDSTYKFYPGDFPQRQAGFVDNLASSFQPLIIINNDQDFQFAYLCSNNTFQNVLLILLLTFLAVAVVLVIAVTVITVKMHQ
ncbi:hypothetical protein SS50377_26270 [Spironucleus salmonicida]|uniref:Uncharacterized protein n=1 Tax=Spironucleus salmonicida TaxID=348837 RepID=A0A9P8LPQ0_9EUKA|nr:hypothetical protein SS50377_26270 [Spironucleus salmonicida]